MGTPPPLGSPAGLSSRILTFWRLLAIHSPDQCIRTSKQIWSGAPPLHVETRNTGFGLWQLHGVPISSQPLLPVNSCPQNMSSPTLSCILLTGQRWYLLARVTYLANKRHCSQRTRKAALEGQHTLYMNNLKTDLLLRTGQKRHFHR